MSDHADDPGRARWTEGQLLLTAGEAARTLSVGRTTLYALIKEGQLTAVHIGRSCRLSRAELIRYVGQLNGPISLAETQPRRTGRQQGPALADGVAESETDPSGAA